MPPPSPPSPHPCKTRQKSQSFYFKIYLQFQYFSEKPWYWLSFVDDRENRVSSIHFKIQFKCYDDLKSSVGKLSAKSFQNSSNQFTLITGQISIQNKFNGPFAASGHMVQNPPCWRASYALGHPKQRKCKFILMKSLCSGCPSGMDSLLSSMADFVPCDR